MSHMTELPVVFGLIDVIFQSQLYFVTSFVQCSYWSCQNSYWPWVWSSNYCQVQAFQNYLNTYCRDLSCCFIVFPWYQVIVYAWCCHVSERRHVFFLLIRNNFQRIFLQHLSCHSSKAVIFSNDLFFRLVFFVSLRCPRQFLEQLGLGLNCLGINLCISFVCIPNTLDLSMALDHQGRDLFCRFFLHGSACSVSFQSFFDHRHKPVRIVRASCAREDIHIFGTFPNPLSHIISSHFLPQRRPANGWPHKFLSRGTTGSSILSQIFGLWRGSILPQISGHASFSNRNNVGASVISTWVYAETA